MSSPSFGDKLTDYVRIITTPNIHIFSKLAAVEEILHVTNLGECCRMNAVNNTHTYLRVWSISSDNPPMDKIDSCEVTRGLTQLVLAETDTVSFHITELNQKQH